MDYETILYQIDDGVLTITLNRPEKLNAFTMQMAEELIHAFNTASVDDAVQAIVVTGAGKGFCAGMDLEAGGGGLGLANDHNPTLADLEENFDDPEYVSRIRDSGGRVTLAIFDCNKPVIAAINGAAVGIGATMTCAMDVRLGSEYARIGFVFTKVGLVPEAASSWFLPRIVGMGQALEWIYTADVISAEEAQRGRFLNRVVPADQLLEEAYKIARTIASRSQVGMAITRQMMYRNSAKEHPVEAHKVDSLGVLYASRIGFKEGAKAFFEKRDPVFTDTLSQDAPDFYPWWE